MIIGVSAWTISKSFDVFAGIKWVPCVQRWTQGACEERQIDANVCLEIDAYHVRCIWPFGHWPIGDLRTLEGSVFRTLARFFTSTLKNNQWFYVWQWLKTCFFLIYCKSWNIEIKCEWCACSEEDFMVPGEPVDVEDLSVVLYANCCLDQTFMSTDIALKQPKHYKIPNPVELASVRAVIDEFRKENLNNYHFHASKDGEHFKTLRVVRLSP